MFYENPSINTMKKIVAVVIDGHDSRGWISFADVFNVQFNTIAQSDLMDTISSNGSIVDNSAGAYLCMEITAMMKFTHR